MLVLPNKQRKEATMSRQRTAAGRRCYHNDLVEAIGKCLPHRGLPLQVEDARVRWTPRLLVICAVLLGWMPGPNLEECFSAAREVLVWMYSSRRRPGETLAGFLNALSTQSGRLLSVVVASLRRMLIRLSGRGWRWGPWVVMGADGSRVECPMTRDNEKHLGCAGKAKTTPQIFVTTLFHVVSGLPWAWIRGRGDASERGQLREMLKELPSRTLLLMDAGFPSYLLLRALLAGGHDFIVRAGRNVSLLRGLGWDIRQDGQTVYLWPKNHRKRAPLVLRLVEVKSGSKRVYLLTSVRDGGQLTDAEVAELYRMRWGIEIMYRTFKRTLDHHKLRSDTPERAKVELDWYMVGLWMLGLMTLEAMGPPRRLRERWSAARARSSVREAMRKAGRPRRKGGLQRRLRWAIQDSYVRTRPKKARHYPRKKTERPAGRPQIRMATGAEIKAAHILDRPRPPD
jgi:hypothetical protein